MAGNMSVSAGGVAGSGADHAGLEPPSPPVAHAGRGRIEWSAHRRLRRRASLWGLLAGLSLLGVYVGVLWLANSLEHASAELGRLWFWMLPLLLGFGTQVGLFAYARGATRAPGAVHVHGVAASGGASALSMVACCAHHLADVLPLIGLAGAALFLAAYQDLFLLLGVLSNVVGLVYVLGLLHQHGLYPERTSLLSLAARRPLRRALPAVAVSCSLIFAAALVAALD